MAHLWVAESAGWVRAPLVGDVPLGSDAAEIVCGERGADLTWVLLGPPAVRVNGVPLAAGVRVLRDRDEVRAAGRRMFFSAETLATIEPMPALERPAICPRCRTAIEVGTLAVRCPKCHVWHHQSDELPCWLYGASCSVCDQPTALDAGYRWSPEDL